MSIKFKMGHQEGQYLQNIGRYFSTINILPSQIFSPGKLVVCLGPLDPELMASLTLYDGVRVMGPIPISATTVHNQEQNNPDEFSDNQNYYVERQEAD